MPSFISDEEFAVILSTGDVTTTANKADTFINTLFSEIETVKAKADATTITAEQTCSLLEHKYLSLSDDLSALELRNSELDSVLRDRSSELAQVKYEKEQLHLKSIEKDGEIERLKAENSELQKSKRQLVELVGVKDEDISEKNSTIKSYLDKISNLTERAAQGEAGVSEAEAELSRYRAHCEKLLEEKAIVQKHNAWLDNELTTKTGSLLEHRRRSAEIEADISAKLVDIEKQYNESSSSLNWHKERVRELEMKLETLQREMCSAKDDASASEQRYLVEISTASKLVELYKESSEEWSKKAGDLEGVIKALETHLTQAESDYKDKLEKEDAARKEAERLSSELSEKVSKLETELDSSRRANRLDILPLGSFTTEALTFTASGDDQAIVPYVPAGVSGTAIASSLLREGWSLAKLYVKYQEVADALQHEQMGRKQTEAILERVFLEVEEKASVFLEERAEHERMAEACALMNQKLQQSLSELADSEKIIRELKAEVKKCEREYNYAQREITDLQKQVTILLKECRDVQLRYGSVNQEYMDDDDVDATPLTEMDDESAIQKVISENLLSVKDIKGLVEQNVKLRSLVRSLSDEVQNHEMQVKVQFKDELEKHKEEAASRVKAVLERADEQGRMIESLHSSVSMFRKLYEEEHRLRSSQSQTNVPHLADGRKDFTLLLEGSEEASKRIQEQSSEQLRCLENELASQKAEIISLRSERDKLAWEANFDRENFERRVKEFDRQREESNEILMRNNEFSLLIADYRKKLRESSESVHTAEELSQKLNMELSRLRSEKELLLNSEKRAHDEVQDLSKRVYHFQATLETVQSLEQLREEARVIERRKQEEYIKQIERELAEAKKELQDERNNVCSLSVDLDHTRKDAMRQVGELGKRLEAALQAVIVSEARCSNLEINMKLAEANNVGQDIIVKLPSSSNEVIGELNMANHEIERLKSEALANKKHMLQYKSISEVNEAALKQMEAALESFRIEAVESKKSLELEMQSLRHRIHEIEDESSWKLKEAAIAATQKDEILASALAEIAILKDETSTKISQILAMEVQVSGLKEDLERTQGRAQIAQANYERQVILQSETIQELTKTSQTLGSIQEEASVLRRTIDAYKSENIELKAKWGPEKSELEKSKIEAGKNYDGLNEQNKILHSQLEALHIKLAEKESGASGIAPASASDDSQGDAGLPRVVSYLRRSREIAETEISLLKQEKLSLQSQLERAMKAAETAEASQHHSNSRSVFFTEDEFKALKIQVSEMNLLRESNMQLREENRHNFEECHKLREVAQIAKVEATRLNNILIERELEVEGLRKEVELQKKENEHLQKHISDICEAPKNINLEEYKRLKSEVEELRTIVREKEVVIEDARIQISQRKELLTKLDHDLTSTRLEMAQRDSHLAEVEALKSDVEKQKKVNHNIKRRVESLLKEKEVLSREKECLLREKQSLLLEKETLGKEKDSLLKEKEVLLKENDELSKEKQAILKQLEDLRRDKKVIEDISIDPAMREREKVKDHRIQVLESSLATYRKEKEKRQGIEKSILAKVESVDMERKKFEDQIESQKEAVRKISDELERLKHARDSLPVGTSVLQLLSANNLDGLASAYVLAIENFEREAHIVLNDVGSQGSTSTSSAMATPIVASTTQASLVEVPTVTPLTAPPPIHPTENVTEEREKKVSSLKSRKLVRPRLIKSGALHRNVHMSDLDRSKNAGNPGPALQVEKQTSDPVSSEPLHRKRPVSPTPSETQGEHLHPENSSTGFPEPSLKKSKGLESLQQDFQAPGNVEIMPAGEELPDAVSDVHQGLTSKASEFVKDVEAVEGQENEAGESQQPNDTNKLYMDSEKIVTDEDACKVTEIEQMVDESSDLLADQDEQDPMNDVNVIEAKMIPDTSYLDVGDDTTITGSQDATDVQPESSTGGSMPSSSQVDDDPLTMDVNEVASPDMSNADEQMEGELTEDVAQELDKSDNGDEQTNEDTENTSESVVSRESGQEPPQPSTASKTINLVDRARAGRFTRIGQSSAASSSDSTIAPNFMPGLRRGRGGPLIRGRGRRGAR